MKNTNTAVAMPRHEFDHIGQLLETIRSQSEQIARLTAQRNEQLLHDTLTAQRQTKVFRIQFKS